MEARLLDDEGTLTVAEVGRRVERALRREVPAAVWVRGEIHNLKRQPNGHVYFSLVGEGCSLPVVLFSKYRERVNRSLHSAGNAVRMADGTEVRVRVELEFYAPRGQVSLRMLAIDPAFTLGRLAERKEVLLRRLDAEGVLHAQRRLALPALPLRIGVVTSLDSAAHVDLTRTLAAAGIGWQLVECHASVQGPDAEPSIVAALHAVAAAGVDVVCLVRGGGARTDLAAFDTEPVARAIAGLAVPVLTGIGHEVDTSVADAAAFARHATPTACGAWLVERAQRWCDRRDETFRRCLVAATAATERAGRRLDRRAGAVSASTRHHLRAAGHRLDGVAARAARRPGAVLDAATAALDQRAVRVASADPARLLARGWSITRTDGGRLVRSTADAPPGTVVVSTVADGAVRSRVEDDR